MTNRTPGPWVVQCQGPDDPLWIMGPEPENIFIARMGSVMGEHDASRETSEVDARLIAAAPELLAACQKIVDGYGASFLLEKFIPEWQRNYIFNEGGIEDVKAAIARATS